MRVNALVLSVAIGLGGACGLGEAPVATYGAVPKVQAGLFDYGLEVAVAPDKASWLGWQAPAVECAQVYRIRVAHTPTLLHEPDSESSLGLSRTDKPAELPPGPVAVGAVEPLWLFYQGLRAERTGVSRDVYVSAHELGPASPSAACYPRTWDPMEDALALGWPWLPNRLVTVGESWQGQRVEGKCNISACVDPKTGGGGPDNHHRTCVTMAMAEQLVGVAYVGGEKVALIESQWSDGHGSEGVRSERWTLVAVDSRRPMFSHTTIEYPFPQPAADKSWQPIVRSWTLESIDDCPGSLRSAGWNPGPEAEAEVQRVRERLAATDEQRRSKLPKRRRDDSKASAAASG